MVYNVKIMRIVIVGAGRTGIQLTRYLIQEKHEVSLIEMNEERARHASNRLDCLVLRDEGNSLAALEEAGVAQAQALVCVTDSDETNMIICGLAASRYPELLKIARVRNEDYLRLNQHVSEQGRGKKGNYPQETKILGIDCFIHPDVEAARAVLKALSHKALGNILDFAGTSYELASVTVTEGSNFDGLCLKDFRSLVKIDCLVTLLEREAGSSYEFTLPKGSTVLGKGDRIYILAREADMDLIFSLAGHYEKPLRRIGIVGGGHIGVLVAEGILNAGRDPDSIIKSGPQGSLLRFFNPQSRRRITLIEQNYALCKELAARLPGVLILNEDISDENFVAEEHLGNLDLIITATANQELNIITAVYLKSLGVKRAIAMVSGPGYENIARKLGVDVVISTQSVVADTILSNLIGKGLREVHHLGDGTLQILEVEISDDSPVAEKAVTEFKLSTGGLIMMVSRGEASFIPRGDYVFQIGDKIILIAKNGSESELEKYFGKAKPPGKE